MTIPGKTLRNVWPNLEQPVVCTGVTVKVVPEAFGVCGIVLVAAEMRDNHQKKNPTPNQIKSARGVSLWPVSSSSGFGGSGIY